MSENDDLEQINHLVRELYLSICFGEGEKPEPEKLKYLFIEESKLISNNGAIPAIMDVDTFISSFKKNIDNGTIKSFRENEVYEITELFGKIAHRFSTYEARFDVNSTNPFSVGINSIQMIKSGENWKVSSMIWNDETSEMKIPEKYLNKR